jgi:hypothetical protein
VDLKANLTALVATRANLNPLETLDTVGVQVADILDPFQPPL